MDLTNRYLEPQDLKVRLLDFLPHSPLNDPGLTAALGRDFLGPDEVVALIQVAVARSVDYQADLEGELLSLQAQGKDIPETIFRKNLSGIGRGHSLDGLPVIALGINGTKMIDSAFTGMVYSRSLVTSGRRRETTPLELVVPRSIREDAALFEEYRRISEDLAAFAAGIKTRFSKKLDAIQALNKLKPYNDPADLFFVLPLSSLVNLAMQVEEERLCGTQYLPEECAFFVEAVEDILDGIGMGQLYRMRKAVPRETYLHYSLFRAPEPDYASERHRAFGNPLVPQVASVMDDLPLSARAELAALKGQLEGLKDFADADDLYRRTCRNKEQLSRLCRRYNEALRVQTISSLSWRVWSEQKRHGTLAQHVESIYAAASRACELVCEIWPAVQAGQDLEKILPLAEQAFVISDELKGEPDMLRGYLFHTVRQIMFYGRLLEQGIPARDALYVLPRNIRVRTLESYDLINAVSLELPLRLCTECEPERRRTSELKAACLKERLPELAFLFEPKCNLGYCTEGKFCANILRFNPGYMLEVHKAIAQIIAQRAGQRPMA